MYFLRTGRQSFDLVTRPRAVPALAAAVTGKSCPWVVSDIGIGRAQDGDIVEPDLPSMQEQDHPQQEGIPPYP